MAISANVKGIMDQLGIYVDIVAIGKPVTHVQTFQSDLSLFMDNDLSGEACISMLQSFLNLYSLRLR